jgi:hypothetical protein
MCVRSGEARSSSGTIVAQVSRFGDSAARQIPATTSAVAP